MMSSFPNLILPPTLISSAKAGWGWIVVETIVAAAVAVEKTFSRKLRLEAEFAEKAPAAWIEEIRSNDRIVPLNMVVIQL